MKWASFLNESKVDDDIENKLKEWKGQTAVHEKLAKKFAELLLKEIGPEDFKKVVELNKDEKDENICHSHDFCDANMIMDAAFKANGVDMSKYHGSLFNPDFVDTWNASWDLAKANDMFIKDLIK